jgi:hypothetical protein
MIPIVVMTATQQTKGNTMATKLNITPEQLVEQLVAAKKAEAEANKQRVQIEEQIIALFGNREEGAETHELGNGLKVTITGKLTYKARRPRVHAELFRRLIVTAFVYNCIYAIFIECRLNFIWQVIHTFLPCAWVGMLTRTEL